MDRKWLNKSDILKDLAEVSGPFNEANNLTSIQDRPPIKAEELDLESELYLKMCGATTTGSGHTSRAGQMEEGRYPQPDLPIIQRMLQMLYDAEDLTNFNQTEDFTKYSNQKIVVSKLNASVKPFVPKSMKEDKSPEQEMAKLRINNETKEKSEISQVVCKDKAAQASEINEDIIIPKKEDVVETKRNVNVAITSINAINAEATSNKIKLYTPDDFLLKPKNSSDNLMAENIDSFRANTHFDSETLKEDSTNDPIEEEPLVGRDHDPNIEVIPQEVQASIKKVTNWLEPKSEEPPKANRPFLGTITYKKKQPVSSTSDTQSSLSGAQSPISCVSPVQNTSFKPTAYAEELYEKFAKHASSKLVAKEDIWMKLQRELQEKDAELRRKALEEEKSRTSPAPVHDKRKKKFRGRRLL